MFCTNLRNVSEQLVEPSPGLQTCLMWHLIDALLNLQFWWSKILSLKKIINRPDKQINPHPASVYRLPWHQILHPRNPAGFGLPFSESTEKYGCPCRMLYTSLALFPYVWSSASVAVTVATVVPAKMNMHVITWLHYWVKMQSNNWLTIFFNFKQHGSG